MYIAVPASLLGVVWRDGYRVSKRRAVPASDSPALAIAAYRNYQRHEEAVVVKVVGLPTDVKCIKWKDGYRLITPHLQGVFMCAVEHGTSGWLNQVYQTIVPPEEELQLVTAAVLQIEACLETFGENLKIKERHRIGSMAKKTILRGRKEADIQLVLCTPPTFNTLKAVAAVIFQDLSR